MPTQVSAFLLSLKPPSLPKPEGSIYPRLGASCSRLPPPRRPSQHHRPPTSILTQPGSGGPTVLLTSACLTPQTSDMFVDGWEPPRAPRRASTFTLGEMTGFLFFLHKMFVSGFWTGKKPGD